MKVRVAAIPGVRTKRRCDLMRDTVVVYSKPGRPALRTPSMKAGARQPN
jgi:hypothetical protein